MNIMANYAKIKNFDIANGDGISVSIFLSGCDIHCVGCFNSELWDFWYGEEFTKDTMDYLMELCKNKHIDHLSILGGEPLHPYNQDTTYWICSRFKELYPNKKIWLWTGYSIDYDLFLKCFKGLKQKGLDSEIIGLCDVVVDQPFIEKEKDLTLAFCGSRNQRVVDIKKTINKSKITMYETN